MIVYSHEPEHLGGQGVRWVDPFGLGQHVNPVEVQFCDFLRSLSLQLAGDVREGAPSLELGQDVDNRSFENWGQRCSSRQRVGDLLRIGIYACGLDGQGELAAVAIEDGPPLSIERDPPQALIQCLILQFGCLNALNQNQPGAEDQPGPQKQSTDHEEPDVLGAPPPAPHPLLLGPARVAAKDCSAQPGHHRSPSVASRVGVSSPANSPISSVGTGIGAKRVRPVGGKIMPIFSASA